MEFLEFAIKTTKQAGEILKNYFNQELEEEEKGFANIVTKADKEAEKIIIKNIKSKYPDHTIITEESGRYEGNEYVWIIDPLDGTTNFKHHIPYFNISIALKKGDKRLLGVVYNPILDEMYYADDYAYMNGKRIFPMEDSDLDKMFLGVCHSNTNDSINRFLTATNYYKFKVREIRRLGSSALEICYVASGKLAAFFGYNLKVWDFEAAIHIAEKAGCYIEQKENDVFVYGSKKIKDKLIFK